MSSTLNPSVSAPLSSTAVASHTAMPDSPENGHLGTSWEIAVVVVVVLVVFALVGTTIFHYRRKRQRTNDLNGSDAEAGRPNTSERAQASRVTRPPRIATPYSTAAANYIARSAAPSSASQKEKPSRHSDSQRPSSR